MPPRLGGSKGDTEGREHPSRGGSFCPGEFPVDRPSEMDAVSIEMLTRNMRRGRRDDPSRGGAVCPVCGGRGRVERPVDVAAVAAGASVPLLGAVCVVCDWRFTPEPVRQLLRLVCAIHSAAGDGRLGSVGGLPAELDDWAERFAGEVL